MPESLYLTIHECFGRSRDSSERDVFLLGHVPSGRISNHNALRHHPVVDLLYLFRGQVVHKNVGQGAIVLIEEIGYL